MQVELVTAVAADGLRLEGALHVAAGRTPGGAAGRVGQWPIDACVFLHGVGGNFYSGSLWWEITPPLLEQDISVLWANTRGHDQVFPAAVGGRARPLGAAYENVDECRLDIAAWAELLIEKGFHRVGLLGHSLGAIKAVYAQARQPHPAVTRIVAVSPPCISYRRFMASPRADDLSEGLAEAERLTTLGRPDALIEVKFPFRFAISAGTFVDKYGRAEHYNLLKFADQVSCPALYLFGGAELAEGNPGVDGLPEELAGLCAGDERIAVEIIPGATHNYRGRRRELAGAVLRWLGATGR